MPVHTNQKTKTPEEATLWGFLCPIMYRAYAPRSSAISR